MYANQNDISRNSSKRGWWVGGLLMVAAALAVWLAFRATPAPAPLGAGHPAPGANTENVADYLIAHGEPPAAVVRSLPASQGALDAVLARDSDHPITQ